LSIEGKEVRIAIGKATRKIREEKAVGVDGVPEEVWKYGREEVTNWTREFCNRIWKGEAWPEDCNKGMIIPIVKE